MKNMSLFVITLLAGSSILANEQQDQRAKEFIDLLKKELTTYCYSAPTFGNNAEKVYFAKQQSALNKEHQDRWTRWITSPTQQIHTDKGCQELYMALLKKFAE